MFSRIGTHKEAAY